MSYFQNFMVPLAQENYLQRAFYEALRPTLMYLAAAPYEEMQTGNGDTIIRTVPGRMNTTPTKILPGKDIVPESIQYEHFVTTIDQYGSGIDIPTNQAEFTLAGAKGYMLQKMIELADQAGAMTNRMARDAIFKAYLGGNTVVSVANGNTTTIRVAQLNGFWDTVKNGKPAPISPQNPRLITINNTARNAIGYEPDDENFPDGPGTLTLNSAFNALAGHVVLADDRSRILRPKNTTLDLLQPNDVATLALFRRAAAELSNDGVGTMSDGYYHVHCAPFIIQELGNDNEWQRALQGQGLEPLKKDGTVNVIGKLRFYDNNQSPQPGAQNSGTPITVPDRGTPLAAGYYGELTNAIGTQVQRSIVMGEKAVTTLYADEYKAMLAEAGQPVGGRPSFAMVGNQLQMMANDSAMGNIRITIRPPIDRAGQQVAVGWTTTRGFAVYCNLLSGQSKGRYKRAMAVETGFESIG